MDSSSHSIDPVQLEQLKKDCKNTSDDIMLFIHHPPLLCGCYFMDHNYPLLNHEVVYPLIQSLQNIKFIICGHYHTEKTVFRDGQLILLTPSTMLQFNQTDPNFKIDFEKENQAIGWRMIVWREGTIESCINYVK